MRMIINKTPSTPALNGDWNHQSWTAAEPCSINNFRPESSSHRPQTETRVLYDENGLHLIFRVQDRYVRSVRTKLNSNVCKDSCVEFFVAPKEGCGYLNFEVNCGGTLLCSHVKDHTRSESGFADFCYISEKDAEQIGIFHSMPAVVDPEVEHPTTWINQLFIPFDLISAYVGDIDAVAGNSWHANFYKCGDETSHPHWAAWAPVRALNFHDPDCFGELVFSP